MSANLERRLFLRHAGGALLAGAIGGCANVGAPRPAHRVVVVGAGYGGTTAAKYLRLWSGGAVDVTLVDPAQAFVSCPMSNLVIGGSRTLDDITFAYDGLARHGVRHVRDTATAIDPDRRIVRTAGGHAFTYDRLVLSPGVAFVYDGIDGLGARGEDAVPHAWKAGPQTVRLRRELEAMPDGGVFVLSIPLAPYRCPPGPYERATQVAHYFRRAKPRSKVIILDANPQIVSKGPLFTRVWKEDHAGRIEYRPNARVTALDGRAFVTEFGDRVRGDVLNLVPPQRAGALVATAGLATAHGRWCEVDWRTLESRIPRVHVLGDATLSAPGMPKSGHMANQHGKTVAAAIVEVEQGREPPPPLMANTCYSFVDDGSAIHVTSVHQWVEAKRTLEPVQGAGGVSGSDRTQWAIEGRYAHGWARTIWNDMLA